MNTLFTIKTMNISSPFKPYSVTAALLTTVLLTVFSASALADRPAMEERSEAVSSSENAIMENAAATQDDSISDARPEAEDEHDAPSAVELMMQQQADHSAQLPATEIQPGETIKIKLLDEPRRGMSMDKVQQLFGQPLATSESVGNPPITNWTYGDRIVYFEYSTVIHVVAR
jgi:hypothetical protein